MVDWQAMTSADELRAIGEGINETLRHRGPDTKQVLVDAEAEQCLDNVVSPLSISVSAALRCSISALLDHRIRRAGGAKFAAKYCGNCVFSS
jgi:asparagine synthetase B (glutamine-hydrolysing)